MPNHKLTIRKFCRSCAVKLCRGSRESSSNWRLRKYCSSCLRKVKQEHIKKHGIPFTSSLGKKLRRKQIKHEEAESNRLRAEGYEVFSPTVVCDRIAVKVDKVFFVEFKQPGQKLREGQKRIQELVPNQYLIRYK